MSEWEEDSQKKGSFKSDLTRRKQLTKLS